MRINYHTLSSKISDRQTFHEYIHGASRFIRLFFSTNAIKFKNSIATILKMLVKPLENQVVFTNSKMLEKIRILFRSDNDITFDDSSRFYVREIVKSKDDNVMVFEDDEHYKPIKEMVGTLNDYRGKTILDTIGKKVYPRLLEFIKLKKSNITFKDDNSKLVIQEKIDLEDNDITFDDSNIIKLRIPDRLKNENIIKIISEKVYSILARIINPKNSNITFNNNNISLLLEEQINLKSTDIVITNSNSIIKLTVSNKSNSDNTVIFENENPYISMSEMSGSLNDYSGQTIHDTFFNTIGKKVCSILSEIIKPNKTDIVFQNDNSSLLLTECITPSKNNITVKNSDNLIELNISNEPNSDNIITFKNEKVDATASYKTQISMMTGALNDYSGQTIFDTLKTKVN